VEALKNAVSVVSVSMIIYGIVLLLVPSDSMYKSIKYVASVSLLSAALVAFRGVELSNIFDLNVSNVNNDIDYTASVNDCEIDMVETTLKDLIENKILNIGITDAFCEVKADILKNTSISITEVKIYCKASDEDKIKQVIDELGITAEFYTNGG
jgi:hypothetical protein